MLELRAFHLHPEEPTGSAIGSTVLKGLRISLWRPDPTACFGASLLLLLLLLLGVSGLDCSFEEEIQRC